MSGLTLVPASWGWWLIEENNKRMRRAAQCISVVYIPLSLLMYIDFIGLYHILIIFKRRDRYKSNEYRKEESGKK